MEGTNPKLFNRKLKFALIQIEISIIKKFPYK